ncbi:hypothetical protein ACWDSK_15150, partial [Nocardia farcinica]
MFANLFAAAYRHIDVLVYAAVFLHEAYPRLNDLLVERAEAGCAIRIAVGDADSANVQQRGREEKFGHGSNDQNLWIPGGRAFPEDDRRSHRILIKTSV